MQNSQIKHYAPILSTNYPRLLELLRDEKVISGFMAWLISDDDPDKYYTKGITLKYRSDVKCFEIGNSQACESNWTDEQIIADWKKWNVHYFDIPDEKRVEKAVEYLIEKVEGESCENCGVVECHPREPCAWEFLSKDATEIVTGIQKTLRGQDGEE